jgi:hypothetical protein
MEIRREAIRHRREVIKVEVIRHHKEEVSRRPEAIKAVEATEALRLSKKPRRSV